MKHALTLVMVLAAMVAVAGDKPQSVTMDGFTVKIPKTWKTVTPRPMEGRLVAIRQKSVGTKTVRVGELLFSPLNGSVDKESSGMAASAKKNPGAIKLLEAGIFKTNKGVKGKRVVLAIAARNEFYQSPMVFYSIYLPKKDGKSVTFKLHCSHSQLASLRKEFVAIVSSATRKK